VIVERLTLQDIARTAGVSLATVDRVLNNRAGVRSDTATRVRAVVASLDYQPDRQAARLARRSHHRFCFVLPSGDNAFMVALGDEIRHAARQFSGERAEIEIRQVNVFDGHALAAELVSLAGSFDGVATVALDHPAVRQAIDDLSASGMTVVTLISDAPRAARAHFVGIDNLAAGRTAATLLGRFLGGRSGKVGLIAGSLALRDHIERQLGFEQVLQRDFENLKVLPVREGGDMDQRVEKVAAKLLNDTPDLIGIYNVGAGTGGLVAALEKCGRARDVVLIAHELTPVSRRHLIAGTIDAIINQDPGHEVRSAIRLLIAEREGTAVVAGQERIRIDVFLAENIP
jgi:LacI family transcriptional regulator